MDDPFDPAPRGGGLNIGRLILNVLTVIVLLTTLYVGFRFVTIFLNPQSPSNPYPPPTLPATLGPPTPTNTPAIMLPTEIPPTSTPRPLPTIAPTATETVEATVTPEFTVTPEGSPPATAESGAQFELQTGSPTFIPDERGCQHMGVGGKVYDLQGAPIVGLAVRVSGELAGTPIGPLDTLTGSAADRFGFGGYYFELSDTPTASVDTLLLQVLDASSGLELSVQVTFSTFDSCEQNLVFVNWAQSES
ncbi:MAG: hypothetical protein ACE5JF_01570 [Anaerolineales bacterium]